MASSRTRVQLTPEERLLWDSARHWRQPVTPEGISDLDWARILEVALTNRAPALLRRYLEAAGLMEAVPTEERAQLEEEAEKQADTAAKMSGPLRQYLRLAAARGVDTVVMKGLAVSLKVHGDASIRPGADIDLLVRHTQVADALGILAEMGFGRWWPKLMEDAYYARHHLHQLRCDPATEVWMEIHWTLDHPYTLLTMDMDALMDRTSPGELLGEPVRQLAVPDLLLSLAVHLVKHAVYLPSILERPDLARVILADGMLIYYLDIAEVIKQHAQELDWDLTIEIATDWGARAILGAVLHVCREFLEAPVPDAALTALEARPPSRLTRWAMNRMADHEIAAYQKAGDSRLWDFLLSTNDAFILRPIRLLDSFAFFFPDRDYLQRRYGSDSGLTRLGHLGEAAMEYARLSVDSVYYAWKRYRRVRYHNRHGVLPDEAPRPWADEAQSAREGA